MDGIAGALTINVFICGEESGSIEEPTTRVTCKQCTFLFGKFLSSFRLFDLTLPFMSTSGISGALQPGAAMA